MQSKTFQRYLINILVLVSLQLFLSNINKAQTTNEMFLSNGSEPSFVVDENGSFHLTYKDNQIRYSKFSNTGTLIKNFNLSPVENVNRCFLNYKHNKLIAVWRLNSFFNNTYIKGMYIDTDQDSVINNPVTVSDEYGDAIRFNPRVNFFNDSTVLITWDGDGALSQQSAVYGRFSDASLTNIDSVFMINDDIANSNAGTSRIILSQDSAKFLSVWVDDRTGIDKIYGRMFTVDGTPLAQSFLISDSLETTTLYNLSGTLNPLDGKFAVLWAVDSNPVWQLKLRWVDQNGIPESDILNITSAEDSVIEYPDFEIDIDYLGRMVVVWEEYSGGKSAIFSKRYSTTGNPYGQKIKVSQSSYADNVNQYYPKVKFYNNQLYYVWWQTNSQSQKIYARIIDFDYLVDVQQEPGYFADDYYLKQNYPNPFNPSTKISWQSPVGSWQTLKVYDILGNEVATLVDEYKSAGTYEVEFNAAKYTSGVYFYRLHAGSFVETKKMILLK